MRHLRTLSLLSVVLGLLGVFSLAGLSSCGSSDTEVNRDVSTLTPIVVLSALGGGPNGETLGGLTESGSPANDSDPDTEGNQPWLIISYPCDLKAQVFMGQDPEFYDGDPIVGDAWSQAGKVYFETREIDFGTEIGGIGPWVAVANGVQLHSDGTATLHNFNGVDGCPSVLELRARFVPSTVKGGPKRNGGGLIPEGSSDTYQTFNLATTESPFVNAYITVEGDIDPETEQLTKYALNIENGAPSSIPGTRAVVGEDGTPQVFPINFTIHLQLKGVHTYTLFGKSHVSDDDGEESEDNFAFEMQVDNCSPNLESDPDDENASENGWFSFSFGGTSPKGNGPIISQLYIGGSTWNIGDPHAARTPPAPNQQPTAQLFDRATEGTTVTWDATGSSDPDGSIVRYDWDFDNDGDFELLNGGPIAQYTYNTFGTVTARVVVTDNTGATAQATDQAFIGD